MARRLCLLALSLLALAAPTSAALADPCPGSAADSGCQALGAFGNQPAPGQAILRQPQAVALDGVGNLLVGDRWSYAIQRFDPSHAATGSWGEYGDAPGQFGAIGGIAASPDGSVYALDTDHNRVEKFVPDGSGGYRFDRAWGGRGSDGRGPADFDIRFTGDVAVGDGSRIYVADTYNQRVAYYDPSGRYLGQLGETDVAGSDPLHLRYPQGLAIDGAGNVYVADDRNDRVQKFSSTGQPLASIGQSSELNNPYDAGVDANGNVYVADNLGHRVVKYAPDATATSYTLSATWGGRGDAPGQMLTPRSIAVAPDGTNYVTDTGNGRIEVFDANGNLQPGTPFGLNGRDGGNLTGPMGLALTPDSLLVADALQYRVQRMSADGATATGFWGSHGDDPDELWLAESAAPTPDGGSWVADTGNDRIQHFDAAGNSVNVLAGFSAPRGIATDAGGNVFVADTGAGRVVKLDPNGTQVAAWNAGGALQTPTDVAVDLAGAVYVADSGAQRLFVLDAAGNVVRSWPGQGSNPARQGPGAFQGATGVALDAAGNVFVADPGSARVSKYAADGTWLASFGERGHAPGKFWTDGPRDVIVAPGDTVLASDPYANEVDRVAQPGPASAPAVAGARASNLGAATATVAATLDTRGLGTTYWLDLGPTTAYGTRAATATSHGAGPLSLTLGNLAPHRLYHYRLVAAGPGGMSYGPDATFTTQRAIALRTPRQRLKAVLTRGMTLTLRAGERVRGTVALTISRRTARRLGLRARAANVEVAKARPQLRRNRWVTVHARLTRRVRKALAANPRRLTFAVTARTSNPAGTARARITPR